VVLLSYSAGQHWGYGWAPPASTRTIMMISTITQPHDAPIAACSKTLSQRQVPIPHNVGARCYPIFAHFPDDSSTHPQVPSFIRFTPLRIAHVQSYTSSAPAKAPSSNQPRAFDSCDLPTSCANEREVSVQWDGATRSNLWVTSLFHHLSGSCRPCLSAITYSSGITADALNAFTPSRSSG
jgi:hypothetical protein